MTAVFFSSEQVARAIKKILAGKHLTRFDKAALAWEVEQ